MDHDYQIVDMRTGVLVDTGSVSDLGDLDTSLIRKLYADYGAVLISGLQMDTHRFVALTDAFCADFIEYKGGADNNRDAVLPGNPTVLTVTGGSVAQKAIPLHGEMYYTGNRPGVLHFCCLNPGTEGGQTTICDGVELWANLPPQIRSAFERKRLRYVRTYSKEQWVRTYQTTELDEVAATCDDNGVTLRVLDDGAIETTFVTPGYVDHRQGRAFVNSILVWLTKEVRGGRQDSLVRFEDGSEIPLPQVRNIYRVAQALTEEIAWQAGDVALIDNTRFMHGRTAYDSASRDIIMRLSMDQIDAA